MTIDGQKPLQVGQVLEGLLEGVAGAEVDAGPARTGSAPAGVPGPAARPRLALWERMMAALDVKFDGDRDGDVRGEG